LAVGRPGYDRLSLREGPAEASRRLPGRVPAIPNLRFRAAALSGFALLLAACGDEPAPAPAPKPVGDAVPLPVVDWNPEDLKPVPGELVAEPGSGRTWMTGVVVDAAGNAVAGADVEIFALPRGDVSVAPTFQSGGRSGPDGSFRVGPGPTPWWNQGMLSAMAPGFARCSQLSHVLSPPGAVSAEEGKEARLVLQKGYGVRGEVRARDGGPPDGPLTIWATGRNGYFEVVTTDAAGAFALTAPEGPVTVRVLDGPHPFTFVTTHVAPEGNEPIRLQVVRGRDIRGRIVDQATGLPVPGAVIRAYYGETRILLAGADGEFLLPKFWFHAFQAKAPGYATRTHQLSDDAGAPEVGPETVRLAPGLVARGRVVDTDGRPVKRARLKVLETDSGGGRQIFAGPATGADGRFVFVGLPLPTSAEEVRVFAMAEGYTWGASAPLPSLPGRVVDGVEVRLVRLVDLRGRIEDASGAPCEGRVECQWEVPKGLEAYRDVIPSASRSFAAADGEWRSLMPEDTAFRGKALGDAFADLKFEARSPKENREAAASREPDLVLRVDRGMAIQGFVRDTAGRPIGRGDVRVEPHPPTDPRPSRDASVKPDGTFEVGGLVAGLYDFKVVIYPDFIEETAWGVAAGAPPVKMVLRRPGSLRFHAVYPPPIPGGTALEASLRALEETKPLPSSLFLRLNPASERHEFAPLTPVAYSLTVVSGDLRADVERVVVGEGPPTDLGDLLLKPGGVATGRVLASGAPAAGALVEVFRVHPDGRSESVRKVRTGSDGAFRAGGLAAGPHVISVRPEDRPLVQTAFDSAPGETRTVDVSVPEGGRLRVTALDAAGRPVPGARVAATDGSGAGVLFWKAGSPAAGPHETGPDGTLLCAGLPAGDLRVTAEKSGAGTASEAVRVEDGKEAKVEVRLER
jgi:hypothetical protein